MNDLTKWAKLGTLKFDSGDRLFYIESTKAWCVNYYGGGGWCFDDKKDFFIIESLILRWENEIEKL